MAMTHARHVLLIVEDHDPTRWALAKVLRRQGWNVLTAATIAEGLALLEGAEPECLIVDLMLPDGGGETVLRRAREAHPATRVVVTTGSGDEDRLESVRGLGPEGLLRKPVDVDEVCRLCEATA